MILYADMLPLRHADILIFFARAFFLLRYHSFFDMPRLFTLPPPTRLMKLAKY